MRQPSFHKLDFSNLDGEIFEQIVRDLLEAEGFIFKRHSGLGPDYGLDFIFSEEKRSLTGISKEFLWLVQCKHKIKRPVYRNEIKNFPMELDNHGVDGYFLITDTRLATNTEKDIHILNSSDKYPFEAIYWDRDEFEKRLLKHSNILSKYSSVLGINEDTFADIKEEELDKYEDISRETVSLLLSNSMPSIHKGIKKILKDLRNRYIEYLLYQSSFDGRFQTGATIALSEFYSSLDPKDPFDSNTIIFLVDRLIAEIHKIPKDAVGYVLVILVYLRSNLWESLPLETREKGANILIEMLRYDWNDDYDGNIFEYWPVCETVSPKMLQRILLAFLDATHWSNDTNKNKSMIAINAIFFFSDLIENNELPDEYIKMILYRLNEIAEDISEANDRRSAASQEINNIKNYLRSSSK